MPGLRQQLSSFLGFVAKRGTQHANDRSAAFDLNWRKARAALPPGLELQWLGTSGFRIAYEGHQILIDPYLTRAPARDVLLRRAMVPSAELADRFLRGTIDAILIGHTHFDHALDAPVIARRSGAMVYGSTSMANLMRLYGLAESSVEVEFYRVYDIGPFAVTFVPSVHSKLVLGYSVPFAGDITCQHFDELTAPAYGCGQVYGIHIEVAGVTFYHQGSADLIEDAMRHHGVDFFLAGIAGRGFTHDYTRRIIDQLQPKTVIPHHYDDFFRPLGDKLEFSFNVNFGGFVDEVVAQSGDIAIHSLDPLQTIRG